MDKEVVHIKVFDKKKGDVLFEGKVSADLAPDELVWLRCFWERGLTIIYNKATTERVESFKGLHNAELVADWVDYKGFSGVLFVGVDDGSLRQSKSVPSCACVMMSVRKLSHEECEKVFKSETLEHLEINMCELRQIPSDIKKLKDLKKHRLGVLKELKSIPEEIGELSNLKELRIEYCGVESLPKRTKELNLLEAVYLFELRDLQLNSEDLVVFSKLNQLKIMFCNRLFSPLFTKAFWEMIKSTVDIRVLELDWKKQDREMVVAALEADGSIVDGGEVSESYAQYFKRNKERAFACVLHLMAIRRRRDALNGVPKEMIQLLAMMLWNTRCDVKAWSKK